MVAKEKLLSTRELAERLGLALITVQRLAQRREIPCRKVANRYRFDLGEIEEWLAAESTRPNPASMDQVAAALSTIRTELSEIRKAVRKTSRVRGENQ